MLVLSCWSKEQGPEEPSARGQMAWRATLRSRGASSSLAPPLVPGRQSGFRAPPCEYPKLIDQTPGNVLLLRNDCCVYNGTLAPVDTDMDHFSPDNGCTHVNVCKSSFILFLILARSTWCVRCALRVPVSILGWSFPALRL